MLHLPKLIYFLVMLLLGMVASNVADHGTTDLMQLEDLIYKHREALQRSPQDGQLWALVALSMLARDNILRDGGLSHDDIMKAFVHAVIYKSQYSIPSAFWVLHNFGKFLASAGRPQEAIEKHTSALAETKRPSEKALVYFYRAACYWALNSLDEALSDYKKALELHPRFYPAFLALTEVMMVHPSVTKQAWRDLLNTMTALRDGAADEDTEILSLVAPDSMRDAISAQFSISIGDLYRAMYNAADRLKEYSMAFGLLEKANQLDEETYPPFDHAESLQRSLSIMKIFRDDNYLDGLGHTSDTPVFIVGMLRSGSAIFENVLGAHSRIVGIGEDSVFNGLLPTVINDISTVMKRSKTVEAVATVIQYHAGNILTRMQEKAERVRKEQGFDESDGPIRYIVDKMVFNFRNIGLIQLLFPYATIIHVIRDPMDTLFSCYSRRFEAPSLGWTRNVDNLISEYVMYLHIMQHFEGLYTGSVTHVIFEKLAANPEQEFRRVIEDVLGLDWEPGLIQKKARPRSVMTISGMQVKREIDFSVVGKWRRYARQLQPLIKKLKLGLLPLKTSEKLLFPEIINWDLDPLFNYYAKYNVSTQGPKWVPDFEFRSGSGTRVVAPGFSGSLSSDAATNSDEKKNSSSGLSINFDL